LRAVAVESCLVCGGLGVPVRVCVPGAEVEAGLLGNPLRRSARRLGSFGEELRFREHTLYAIDVVCAAQLEEREMEETDGGRGLAVLAGC
jgi:hypothetical protein